MKGAARGSRENWRFDAMVVCVWCMCVCERDQLETTERGCTARGTSQNNSVKRMYGRVQKANRLWRGDEAVGRSQTN